MSVDNTQCLQTIDGWIQDLRSLPQFVKSVPAGMAAPVKAECDKAIAAGQSLDGETWDLTVKDNRQALLGAQKDLDVFPSGKVLWIRIRGGLVFSQFGTHRQKPRRVLPARGLPKRLGNAIAAGIVEMAPEFLKRKGGHQKVAKGTKWL